MIGGCPLFIVTADATVMFTWSNSRRASQGLSAKISDFLRKRPNSSMPFSESSCEILVLSYAVTFESHSMVFPRQEL